jgi:insulysin
LDFYSKNYRQSLGLYKLVVLGKESLDDLQEMVHQYFDEFAKTFKDEQGEEKGKRSRADLLKEMYPPMQTWQVPKRLHVIPVSQVHAVELQFPLPPTKTFYKHKPTRYLSHLIGHEGNGSLLSCLKAKHYAQELYSDDSSASCNTWSIFTIRLELTELGLENIDEVISIIFAYIDLLRQKGPQEWIQDELKIVGDLQFKFLSKRNPMDYTCSLAGWMQHYPPEHYLSGAYKLYDWEPEAVSECLNELNPDNMLMTLSSPTMEEKTSSTCPWYGTQYESVPVDEALWSHWRSVKYSAFQELDLPEVNDMIATDFDLLKESSQLPKDMPLCILKTKTIQLWYKPDNIFDMPKVNVMFQFVSKDTLASPEASVAINLFSLVVNELCNEFTYLASMAALHSDISYTSAGLELQVSGYHHKAHILVQRVVDILTGLNSIEPEMFARIVAKVEQQYESFLVEQPYQHAIHGGDLCLDNNKFTVFEKLNALKHLSVDEVLDYSKRFFKHCKVEALVHGNVTAKHTKEMAKIVLQKVKRGDFDQSTTHSSIEHRVVQLPEKSNCVYRFAEYNDANTNSCLQIILQMGALVLRDNATLAFLHHLIREPAFNQLRTEEQLGYIVHTSVKTSGVNIKGLLFLIQSDSFDPIHVESRVEEFIANFRERIISMSAEEFQKNVDAVVTSFLEKVCSDLNVLFFP